MKVYTKKIAPSLLSANFATLAAEVEAVESAGADLLHLDVMDGHFVPNLTIGPAVVKSIRKYTKLPLDCHLMIENPEQYIESFKKAGADMISVHCEITGPGALKKIKSLNAKAGIAINPETPLKKLAPFLKEADYVLVMSVHPGFGGQEFIESTIEKAQKLAALREKKDLSFEIEVDGGIKTDNIHKMANVGVNIFVAGSAIFKSENYAQTIEQMKARIDG